MTGIRLLNSNIESQATMEHHFKKLKISYPAKLSFEYPGYRKIVLNTQEPDFPGGAVVKNPPASAGDMGSSPGPGRSHMPQSN